MPHLFDSMLQIALLRITHNGTSLALSTHLVLGFFTVNPLEDSPFILVPFEQQLLYPVQYEDSSSRLVDDCNRY